MTLVAILTVLNAARERFHDYERQAARIMARYGGAIERTVVIDSAADADTFREVHLVTFRDPESFAAYRDDAELKALASTRAECIVSTEILLGRDGPSYRA